MTFFKTAAATPPVNWKIRIIAKERTVSLSTDEAESGFFFYIRRFDSGRMRTFPGQDENISGIR